MSLTPKQRAAVFAMFDGHCAYCGIVLPEKGWHADHVEPIMREWRKAHRDPTTVKWDYENNRPITVAQDRKITPSWPERDCIENMMPSCRACNLDKGGNPLETWRRMLEQKVRVCRDNYSAFRHAERFGLLTVVKTTVTFYFEAVRHTESG